MKTKRKPQDTLAANSQMNCSSSLKLSPEQQMILRILGKCEEGRGLMLDRKAPKAAAQLERWRFIEGIPDGNGERIYVIVDRGRMALKKAERIRLD